MDAVTYGAATVVTLGVVQLVKVGFGDELSSRATFFLALGVSAAAVVLVTLLDKQPWTSGVLLEWIQVATSAMGIHAAVKYGIKNGAPAAPK